MIIAAEEGEERTKLERYIKLNHLKDKVTLVGHNKNIFPIIKNSIAVISTSLWEDPGAVMIEASFVIKMLFLQIAQMDQVNFYPQKRGTFFLKIMI